MAGGVFSEAQLFGMTIRESATDGSDFTNPGVDYRRLFLGEDGLLHLKDSAGTVTDIGAGSVATDAIWDAAGDLAVGSGANTAAKLTKGTDGQILAMASGSVAWGTLLTVDATLSGNVTMTTSGTYYDGPSASFAAGVWLIWYKCAFDIAAASTEYATKLWDGTTTYDESESDMPTLSTFMLTVPGFALVTLGSTTTLKVSAKSNQNGRTMLRDPNMGSTANSHTATRMTAVRIG
jgi:hypothetical protein